MTKPITRKTPDSVVPLLKTSGYNVSDNYAVFGFEDSTIGIFAPFNGFFFVKFNSVPTGLGRSNKIKLPRIYGSNPKIVYKGNGDQIVEADVSDISVGIYMFYYDIDERRLYLVQ